MKRSRSSSRSDRPNTFSNLVKRGLRRLSGTTTLAEAAGAAPSATFEQLEERQLLFSLTIDPSDPTFTPGPAPNSGSVSVQFAYMLPYLAPTTQVQNQPGVTGGTDFEQGATAGGFASGTLFGTNNGLRIRFAGGGSGTIVQIIGPPQNSFAQITIPSGGSMTLDIPSVAPALFDPDNGPLQQNPSGLDDVQSLRQMILQALGPNGLDPNSLVVDLQQRLPAGGYQTVASFTGTALLALSSTGQAQGIFTFNAPADTRTGNAGAFDQLVIRNTSNASVSFGLDNVTGATPTSTFVQLDTSRIFGAVAVFTGPIGASAQFLDLYGGEMVPTLFLGKWDQQSNNLRVDLNDDGVPDYNDGIGRINITGSNLLTSLTMWGTTVTGTGDAPIGAGFAAPLPTEFAGLPLETAGFGYHIITNGTQFTVTGVPPSAGSVVIGSPWVRPLANYNARGPAIGGANVVGGFNRADQGIFVSGSISSIYIDGPVFGSSQVSGAEDRFIAASLLGSLSVQGDLGLLMTQSDAGGWVADDGTVQVSTGSQIVVGRTLGEISVGGRMYSNVTVVGNLNDSVNHPARDVLRHYEDEFITGIPTNTQPPAPAEINNILNNTAAAAFNHTFLPLARADQALIYGTGIYRNDTIMGSEWVGNDATSVEIHGELGSNDPISTAQDPSDVYGFAVDGKTQIEIRLDSSSAAFLLSGGYFRLVDANGNTVAAPDATDVRNLGGVLRYTPKVPGVLYLVMQAAADGVGSSANVANLPYIVSISGMMPTTAGSIHSAAGMGLGATGNVINILSGSMGSLRAGTDLVDGTQANDGDPLADFNKVLQQNPPPGSEGTIQGYMDLRTTSLTVAGTLYNITLGADMQGATINVGGDFGSLITGQSPVVGQGPTQGDLINSRISVGGSIALLDVRGGVGIDNDIAGAPAVEAPNSVVILTGRSALLRGDIGMFRVGGDMGANTLSMRTPNGAIFGALLISQDEPPRPNQNDTGIWSPGGAGNGEDIQLGVNSDLRFFDVPRIDFNNVEDQHLILVPGVTQTLTDDAGGQFQVTIDAGDDPTAGGLIRLLPIGGSLGGAVGRIEVSLTGGARLRIHSLGNAGSTDVISIGQIVVTNASASTTGTLPSIAIDGNSQVDIWRISQTGGTVFGNISNLTANGDMIAVDMAALGSLTMGSGSLGRTDVPAWGPQLLGPFLNIAAGTAGGGGGGAGGPIPVTNVLPGFQLVTNQTTGSTTRPVNDSQDNTGAHVYLDDIGSPVNPYLNGLIVRSGNIASVTVGGAVGDVIATSGDIGTVLANSVGVRDPNHFRGIVGVIYANNIGQVDVGDGMQMRDESPYSTTGIFANNDIGSVIGGRIPGATISSTIEAANDVALDAVGGTDGINSVTLTGGGNFVQAYIAATNLDTFWTSVFTPDESVYEGDITRISGTNANFLRSDVVATNVGTITLTGGFWDASTLSTRGNVNTITAAGYRNSTMGGGELELHDNRMDVGGNLSLLTTFGRTGDIDDLTLSVFGRTTEISANNIVRLSADSTQGYDNLITVDSLRSSTIRGGVLSNGAIGRSIVSSSIQIAGPLLSLIAGDGMTDAEIVITGPDGHLGILQARTGFTGSITTVGQTTSITVTEGSFTGSVTTLTSVRGVAGDIGLISAAGDLDMTADISGTISTMKAGLNIGNIFRPGVIFVHGNVTDVEAPNGQIYADLRVGNQLNKVVIGRVDNLPGRSFISTGSIIAFGAIAEVDISGDFGGKIISYSGGIGVVTINDGSLLPGAAIDAYAGTITNVFINNGNLYGDIHADYLILAIRLNGSADGVFGDIGVNPAFDQGQAYDAFRNKLPPGVAATAAVQGPHITAGQNIGRIILTNGSMFEAQIYAGRAIGTIDVTGDIVNDTSTTGVGNVIAAASSINVIHATGNMQNTYVMAGVRSFGADNRPGGTGVNADSTQSGRITTVQIDGNGANILVNAGITPGADGVYDSGDETVALGISYVRTVTVAGSVSNVDVLADSPTLTVSPGVVRKGTNFLIADPDISNGDLGTNPIALPNGGTINFNWNGVQGTITFSTDKGQGWWTPSTGQITLLNTSLNTTLVVSAPGHTLTDFRIVTNDDASMGTIRVDATLAGNSKIVVDAYVLQIQTDDIQHADIRVGMNLRNITTGNFASGTITDAFWLRDVVINGDYGTPDTFDEARIDTLAGNSVSITGTDAALINVDRDMSVVAVGGVMNKGQLRVGNSLGALTASGVSESRVSVGNTLGTVGVTGDVFDTAFQAGGDLGSDAAPGGTGEAADNVSAGFIGTVNIGGNFGRSSIVAGQLRGPDTFFGTDDDVLAPGRSTIGAVTIGGTDVGSNLNTQQYRISASGSVGTVMIGGQPPANLGNFKVQTLTDAQPLPIIVTDLQSVPDALVWTTKIFFNQAMNVSTIGPALTVSEVRDGGSTLIPLTQGTDYVVSSWNPAENSISIRFSLTVTSRDLPQQPGVPGPGVYRFDLDPSILRAAVDTARLDGNGDGFAQNNEAFSQDDIVGDAGDKLLPETDISGTTNIDFYGPADLDVVMDNNTTPDGLPDPNTTYTVRGVIGDHPDQDIVNFPIAGDTDIYKITLQAGQILRLGAMQGSASFAGRFLLNSAGTQQGGNTADTEQLPTDITSLTDNTLENDFLIKQTGVFYIVVTNDLPDIGPGSVPIVNAGPSDTGDYNFTVQVFDDGNSGFAAGTDSGNGDTIVNAPPVITFAGADGVFGNGDDRSSVPIGDFTFFLDPGPDGIKGTADDVVSGSNARGITSTRTNFTDLTTTIDSAIGPTGHAGVPSTLTPDVDIYNLNSGQAIAAGTKITIHVKLADIGADLGGINPVSLTDFSSDVQFAVFDVTDSSAVDDGKLVFSPSDFKAVAGTPGTIAQRGDVSYGFDSNGDFFITFITPGKIGGTPGEAAKYAVYLQGAFNTDYQIVVNQSDTVQNFTMPHSVQNVFIETNGGTVNWLEAGGLTTKLAPFTAAAMGFTGTINSQPIDQYILTHLVSELQAVATSQGLNLVFSTDPGSFEFQPFSTIFLTSSNDPKTVLNTDNFGYSQHSDPFNTDQNDEGVVFAPSLDTLGYSPSQADVDHFVDSLAAAVGRRVGELVGLRITGNSGGADQPIDIMSANSVFNVPTQPGQTYGYVDSSSSLSDNFDTVINTNFFLGQQNAFELLTKFLAP